MLGKGSSLDIDVFDLKPDKADFKSDVLSGLSAKPKRLQPMYFYDERGSELFYKICETEDYYATRCDLDILERQSSAICAHIPVGSSLIELGGGGSRKVLHLLDTGKFSDYVPVDISKEILISVAQEISKEYKDLRISAVAANYMDDGLEIDFFHRFNSRVVFFPGSTMGNLTPFEQRKLMSRIRSILGKEGGYFLVGVDLEKDLKVLEAAYNDREGITADFNSNILSRVNRELGANFDNDRFKHKAFYNSELQRIEMHLESIEHQTVSACGRDFHFSEGETIHTENSHKFNIDSFKVVAEDLGYKYLSHWTDDKEYFAEVLLEVPPTN